MDETETANPPDTIDKDVTAPNAEATTPPATTESETTPSRASDA